MEDASPEETMDNMKKKVTKENPTEAKRLTKIP